MIDVDLTLPEGQVRLHIGDTIEDSGPRPEMHNYSSEEITYFISSGGGTVNGGVIEALTALAAAWAAYDDMRREEGVTIDLKGKAETFRKMADYYRENPIGEGPQHGFVNLDRVDFYNA